MPRKNELSKYEIVGGGGGSTSINFDLFVQCHMEPVNCILIGHIHLVSQYSCFFWV